MGVNGALSCEDQVFEFFLACPHPATATRNFDMGTADHGGASSWTARYVTVLSQARWLVLASWALLSVLAAWQGPLFLSECVMRMGRLRPRALLLVQRGAVGHVQRDKHDDHDEHQHELTTGRVQGDRQREVGECKPR